MRSIAVINQKGGVGKTTTVTHLGAAAVARGMRVLLVDLDPQSHLTLHHGIDEDALSLTVYDLLTEGKGIAEVMVRKSENLAILPSDIDLAAAEMELVSVVGRETIVRNALESIRDDFDLVVFDCPPSLSVLTINALTAVNEVLIPLQPHFLALQGLGKLLETVRLVQSRLNPELRVLGVALCMYESGTRLAGEVAEDLRSFLNRAKGENVPWSGARIFQTVIRRNIKLAECPSYGTTIFEYAPKSPGAADYADLAVEIFDPLGPTVNGEADSVAGTRLKPLPDGTEPMTAPTSMESLAQEMDPTDGEGINSVAELS